MKREESEKGTISFDVTIDFSSNENESASCLMKIRKNYEWAQNGIKNGIKSSPKNSSEKNNKPTEKQNYMRETPTFRMYIEDNESDIFVDETLPERIEGFYVYDYNILQIDDILNKKFEQEKRRQIASLNSKLELENVKVKCRQSMIERKASRKNIADYESLIKKYEENIDKKTYCAKVESLLDAYRKIGPISNIVSFLSNNKEEISVPETKEQQEIRHRIISSYLEIARKYIPIDLVRKLTDNDICLGCGVDTSKMEEEEDDDDCTVCSNCGLEKINIIKSAFYADGGRINNCRNNYEDRANFEKVLARYQGKQITKPSKDLYIKLDEYFISRGLPSSKEYNEMQLTAEGTKVGTSREMMFEVLSNIGCSGYYDDINLICSVFFGWSLPDVSHLEDNIMKDYDEFQAVYDQLPDRDGRKSSLNSQWKLFILLRRRGWSCKAKDFKIPTTSSILEYHKVKTKQIYEILGWICPY
jgi:hypothetical protein